uniref:Fes1 domain-containing protein n=1 Tax=Elaeophora elaphi TaxID=1147741 RepID=A0A0R3RYM5_9BILA
MGEKKTTSPQCWSKLLCLAQSANDGSRGQLCQLMSKQDQTFVENAMAEAMQLSDPVKHMTKRIKELKLIAGSEDDVDRVTQIVDNLEELVCDIDCAADFCKLGGLVEVIRLLKSGCDSVRCEIAQLIPSLAQNNPYVQNIALETDLLSYLLSVLEEVGASEEILIKALSSLSSIVRGHEKAFRQVFSCLILNLNLLLLRVHLLIIFSQFYQLKGLERIENVFQKAVDLHHFKLANKAVLITTSIAISLGPDVKQYNVLPVLFRMTLQLASDSVGCSYFLDYLMNNIVDKEVDNNDLKSDEFKVDFVELDYPSKQHFCDFLKRQLKYEEQFPHEDCSERLKKMNRILDQNIRNFELGEVPKTLSNL